jgi:hypothetical protein
MESEDWISVGSKKKTAVKQSVDKENAHKGNRTRDRRLNAVPGMVAYEEDRRQRRTEESTAREKRRALMEELQKRKEALEEAVRVADKEIRQMEELTQSLNVVMTDMETENAARESLLMAEEKNEEIMRQQRAELQAERDAGVLLDMEIETAKEDLRQANAIHDELKKKAERGEKKKAAEQAEEDKFFKVEQPKMDKLQKNLAEKHATMKVILDRLNENTALVQGPISEAILSDCDPKDVIARIPAKVRLLAVPLVRRACRGCLLRF